jgi:hypothetical protein
MFPWPIPMKSTANNQECEAYVARSLAADDLRCGDFVGILHETIELPSFHWSCDGQLLPPDELVRLVYQPPTGGTPLKVKAICLPFVFVKDPSGQHQTLDVRRQQLVRLTRSYARLVWKTMAKASQTTTATAC